MMSAIDGSSDSPCAIERRSARKTSLGRRARCVSSLKVREPNSSAALRCAEDVLRTAALNSVMLRMASLEAAEPMWLVSFRRDGYGHDYGRGGGRGASAN